MANKTVYPYGTDGSLPSSIGIVNDLTTGGSDKALAAQQGKVIGEYIFDQLTPVDISSLTVHNRSLGQNDVSSARWTVEAAKHIAVPVVPGTRMKLTVTSSETTGAWYGLFTDYVEPTSFSSNVYYLPEDNRRWLNKNSSVELTIPTGVVYLIICTKDSEQKSSTWTLETIIPPQIDSKYIPTSNIVNDLITGGVNNVLSAEQGKIIGQQLGTGIPSGLTKYEYTGEKLRVVSDTHYVAKRIAATITAVLCQGGACYGDYLFLFKENNPNCWIFNLQTNSLVQNVTIPDEERGFISNCHCNTVNFGTEFYDANDPFPLIYVSTGYNDGSDSGALVYRITVTEGVYALSLVQTIKIHGTGWTEFIVADGGNCIIRYETSSDVYYRMKMPKLSEGDVTLDVSNAYESYRFPPQGFRNPNQNHIYHDGKLYLTAGDVNEGHVFVLDLVTKVRTTINLYPLGITAEPETIFIWNGQFCIACRSNINIYMLYFE